MTGRHSLPLWLRPASLPALAALATVALMVRSSMTDPGPTGAPGDIRYWHNFPGDLGRNAGEVLVEVAVAIAIVLPWGRRGTRRRALLAALLFLPWLGFNVLLLIHSGGIMVLHTAWLLGLWGWLAVRVIRGAPGVPEDRSTAAGEAT